MPLLDPQEAFRGRLKCFLPGGGMEHSVGAPHKRLGQTLFVMNELEGEAPFDTQIPVIQGLSRRGTADTNDFPVLHMKVHLTADATEVTCGPNLFFGEREHP
jgi:hypothetical protein